MNPISFLSRVGGNATYTFDNNSVCVIHSLKCLYVLFKFYKHTRKIFRKINRNKCNKLSKWFIRESKETERKQRYTLLLKMENEKYKISLSNRYPDVYKSKIHWSTLIILA